MRSAQRGRAIQRSKTRRPTQGQAMNYLKQGTNMTTNNQGSLCAAMDLEQISAELEKAQADVAMLERLKRLSIEYGKASAARDKAIASEAKAIEAERFAGIGNVRVTQSANTIGENLLRSAFTIAYTKPRWDMYEMVQTPYSVDGFGPLPPEVLDYIILKRPSLIPSAISALNPDCPTDAFRQYFLILRRGYQVA